MNNCVYLIENLKTHKFYVGSTNNPKRRMHKHFSALRNGKHKIKDFQNDYASDDDLEIKYIIFETREEASELELLIIEELIDTGMLYNKVRTGNSGVLRLSPKRQLAFAEAVSKGIRRRNAAVGPEQVFAEHSQPGEKNGMFGRAHTPEAKQAVSKANKGKAPPNKGVPMSPERYAKQMAYIAGRDYWGKNNPFHGKTHTQETRDRLREANKDKLPSNMRKVEIDGIAYDSVTSAGRALSIPTTTVLYRVNSENQKFSEWKLIT